MYRHRFARPERLALGLEVVGEVAVLHGQAPSHLLGQGVAALQSELRLSDPCVGVGAGRLDYRCGHLGGTPLDVAV